jgi:hypothetical protein
MKSLNSEEIKKNEKIMQVKIEENCFQNPSNVEDLDAIFHLFKSEQHKWMDIDLEVLQATDWYAGLGKRDKADLANWCVSSTRKSKVKKTVCVSSDSNNPFNIRAAKLFLKQPLVILVENKEYDTPFYESIFRHFDDKDEPSLENAHKNKFWKYEHFAGSSVEQVINGELNNEFKDEAFKEPKTQYLRYFVLLDSDLLYLGNTNNNLEKKKESLKKLLKEEKKEIFYFHALQKREKENYMPESVLKKLNDPYFNTLIKVFQDDKNRKRDFFNFGDGFDNKNKTDKDWKDEDKRKAEFVFFEISKINEVDYQILKSGVKDKQAFKKKFSNHFSKASKDFFLQVIQNQPLMKSDHDGKERNEFEHIIHEIKRLL